MEAGDRRDELKGGLLPLLAALEAYSELKSVFIATD
jgi:hypothetical protein